MSDASREPNVEQVTAWRNVLDALGKLSSSWEGAVVVESSANRGQGTGSLTDDLVTAFLLAEERGAEAMAGLSWFKRSGQFLRCWRFRSLFRARRTSLVDEVASLYPPRPGVAVRGENLHAGGPLLVGRRHHPACLP